MITFTVTFRPADGHSGSGRSTSPYLTRPVQLAPLDEDDAESPGPPGPHRIGPIRATLDRWPRSGPGPPGRPIRPASTSQPVRPPCRGPPPARPDIRPARRLARTYGLPGHGVPSTFSSAVNSSGQDRLKALPHGLVVSDRQHSRHAAGSRRTLGDRPAARPSTPPTVSEPCPRRVRAVSWSCHGRVGGRRETTGCGSRRAHPAPIMVGNERATPPFTVEAGKRAALFSASQKRQPYRCRRSIPIDLQVSDPSQNSRSCTTRAAAAQHSSPVVRYGVAFR